MKFTLKVVSKLSIFYFNLLFGLGMQLINQKRQGYSIIVTSIPRETWASHSLYDTTEVMLFLEYLTKWKKIGLAPQHHNSRKKKTMHNKTTLSHHPDSHTKTCTTMAYGQIFYLQDKHKRSVYDHNTRLSLPKYLQIRKLKLIFSNIEVNIIIWL